MSVSSEFTPERVKKMNLRLSGENFPNVSGSCLCGEELYIDVSNATEAEWECPTCKRVYRGEQDVRVFVHYMNEIIDTVKEVDW